MNVLQCLWCLFTAVTDVRSSAVTCLLVRDVVTLHLGVSEALGLRAHIWALATCSAAKSRCTWKGKGKTQLEVLRALYTLSSTPCKPSTTMLIFPTMTALPTSFPEIRRPFLSVLYNVVSPSNYHLATHVWHLKCRSRRIRPPSFRCAGTQGSHSTLDLEPAFVENESGSFWLGHFFSNLVLPHFSLTLSIEDMLGQLGDLSLC